MTYDYYRGLDGVTVWYCIPPEGSSYTADELQDIVDEIRRRDEESNNA